MSRRAPTKPPAGAVKPEPPPPPPSTDVLVTDAQLDALLDVVAAAKAADDALATWFSSEYCDSPVHRKLRRALDRWSEVRRRKP